MIKKNSSQKLNSTRKIVREQKENPSLSTEEVFDSIPKSAIEIYKDFWKKSFVWKGRASRSEYWYPQLFNFLIQFGLGMVVISLNPNLLRPLFSIFFWITFLPLIALTVRRFHDLGKSVWFALAPYIASIPVILLVFISVMLPNSFIWEITGLLFLLIFYIFFIICTVCLFLKGNSNSNQYGDPRV